ncbi:hypothetical protein [Aquitalea magnusonii]|uniref:hypothetical protein n=1 Tax=Aquitalea magnusonii TaxID=332411 RepID=UPI0011B539DA|nr:hypothetical protein [Aquitalea magnusonii]
MQTTKKGPGQIAQAWLDARLKPQIATGQTHSQTRRHRGCTGIYANTVPAFFQPFTSRFHLMYRHFLLRRTKISPQLHRIQDFLHNAAA